MFNPIVLIKNLIQTGNVFQLSVVSIAFSAVSIAFSALSVKFTTLSLLLHSNVFVSLAYLTSIVAAFFIVLSILSWRNKSKKKM